MSVGDESIVLEVFVDARQTVGLEADIVFYSF
jgi:hypothetical protein